LFNKLAEYVTLVPKRVAILPDMQRVVRSVFVFNPLTSGLNRSAQRCLLRFFTGGLIFKGLTPRRLYKSFGVKGLISAFLV
jgi:hypothetical protein